MEVRVLGGLQAGVLAVSISTILPACSETPSPTEVPAGSWGGDHALLEVDAMGASFELDCAHGRMESPLRLDGEGRFEVGGVYVAEGGPTPQDGFESRPAVFAGALDGDRLDFSLTLADGAPIGPFSVFLDQPPRLLKCLTPGIEPSVNARE